MKVCFKTFGCRLNRAEALEEESKYLAAGWTLTEKHSEANRFVIRGCSVTTRAQRDCEQLIAHLRHKYPNTRIIIQGCLKDDSAKLAASAFGKAAKPASDNIEGANDKPTPVPMRTARAYLKVQDGCAGKCTFCIVPQFRGKSLSVRFQDVLDKAKRFIDAGYHEIVVTGCNLALYASEGKRLSHLLATLAELGNGESRCRIRLGSVEPGANADAVIRTMADHANICRFLHLTVQSGSNRILSIMQRPYLTKDVTKNLELALSLMPMIGLGCDLMTGFPGESDIDFLATKTLLQRIPFSNVHVFPYSKRPGTQAAAMRCQVPKDIRKLRARELIDLAEQKRRTFASRFIGHDVEIIIEDEKKQAGWTSEYVWYEPRYVISSEKHPRKELVTVPVANYDHGKLH